MIVLDTNVISELMRPVASPVVLAWARARDPATLYTTAISEAELHYGIELLSVGRRRADLARTVDAILGSVLAGRVLPFDRIAARAHGKLAAESRRQGRPVGMGDLQIAAIASARGAVAIATRNTRDFAARGVATVDPWQTA